MNKDLGFIYSHAASPSVINSYGFADKTRETSLGDKNRVLLVGDSFVAGTALASLIELRLESLIPGGRFEVVPMAFPGIGLGNMYSFVEHYAPDFKPMAVVAVFNSSTFANNSSLLEAVKLRSHPDHPMRLFFVQRDGQCVRLPVDLDFKQYMLKELPNVPAKTVYTMLEEKLEKFLGWSYVYSWIKDSAAQTNDKAFLSQDREFVYRISQLRSDPEFKEKLSGWDFPDDLDVNSMFWTPSSTMPKVFQEALDATTCELKAFDKLANERGFSFLLAITDDCSSRNELQKREFNYRNKIANRLFIEMEYRNKIVTIAKETGTSFIDLYASFEGKSDSFHDLNDIHWNEDGFKTAAYAIATHLAKRLSQIGATQTVQPNSLQGM